MFWDRIIRWFRDMSERKRLINDWNENARTAYCEGAVPSLLEASTSLGNVEYKHDMSKWMVSGFRIKVKGGRPLTREELLSVGKIILNNASLVRRMVVLGWDTLEVYDSISKKGFQWPLKDFVSMKLTE